MSNVFRLIVHLKDAKESLCNTKKKRIIYIVIINCKRIETREFETTIIVIDWFFAYFVILASHRKFYSRKCKYIYGWQFVRYRKKESSRWRAMPRVCQSYVNNMWSKGEGFVLSDSVWSNDICLHTHADTQCETRSKGNY